MFTDADNIIADALAEAKRMVGVSRNEAARVKTQLAELDKNIADLTKLMLAPDMEPAARKAIIRQMGDLETQREGLHTALATMVDEAHDTTDNLARAVRQAFTEAQESFSEIATPLAMHEFAQEIIGPITLTKTGQLVPGSKSGPRY